MRTPAQQVCDLLKLEIEIICDTLRGAAYNCVGEDDPELFSLVKRRLLEAELEARSKNETS